MKKFYFALVFLFMGLFVFGQTRPTGYSTEVGITEGELSVSLSGAANYTVPIAVPPGINGVTPKLGLSYNSQSDNGPAGYGWTISGLSVIRRIASTKHHDGVVDPVDFDNLDRFALDGQRLIVKSGTSGIYGSNETVYETENFSNIKVTSYGVHSNGANYGPEYFKVEYPDGSKAVYGNSADSRSITDWAISYWENAQGIRINYSYTLSNNILNVTSVKYGSRFESAPINEIQFVYKARQREEQNYTGGQVFIRNTILSDIKVFSNSIGFRNYTLTHDTTSLFYERLTSITEKSGDNTKSYNPTVFEYENTVDAFSMLESFTALQVNPTPIMPDGHVIDNNAENGGDDMRILGDFGMDNKFGLITFSSNAQKRSNYIFYPNIDSNTTSVVGTKIYTKSIFDEIFLVNTLSGNNSSGYKLKQNQNWCVAITNRESNLTTFSMFSSNSNGTSPIKLEHEINYTFPMYVRENGRPDIERAVGPIKTYFSGDFNGDNITDAIIIECGFRDSNDYTPTYLPSRIPQSEDIRIPIGGTDNSGGGVYFVNLDPRVTSNAINFAGRLSGEFRKHIRGGAQSSFFAADIDSDGRTDIVVTTKNIIDVYSLDDNNIFVKTKTLIIPVDRYGYSPSLWPGLADYNGDGRIDYGPKLFSDGISFVPSGNISLSDISASYGKLVDLNNDGTTDVFSFWKDGDNVKFSSTTNLFPLADKKIDFDYIYNGEHNYRYSILNNKNTLSKNQLILYESSGNVNPKALRYLNLSKDCTKDKLLKSITVGNGVKQIITYSSLINGNGVYEANVLRENYPNQDIVNAPEFKIVSKIEKQSVSQYKKQLFFYSGAVTNLDGLGFLGFYSVVKTNWHNDNSQIISYISKNDISLRGANVENYTVLGLHVPLIPDPNVKNISNTIVKEKDYIVLKTENLVATQNIVLKPNTWIKPETGQTFSATINANGNVGTSINTPVNFVGKSLLAYESGSFPNKVFKLKNISNKQFSVLENTSNETKTDYDEYNNPVKVKTEIIEGTTIQQTSIVDITYQNQTSPYVIGMPLSKVQEVTLGGEKTRIEENYSYNAEQLLEEIKKKGDASTNYITEGRAYDTFGNVIKRIVKAGQGSRELSYEYDHSGRFLTKETDAEKLVISYLYNPDGTLKSMTNPLAQTTSFEYDSWFRKKYETDFLGNKDEYQYVNGRGDKVVTKIFADGNVVEETYDDLGRKIKSGSKNIMGTFTYKSFLYDIQDRNYKISEPYIGSAASQWNEIQYDNYGRITDQNDYTGKNTHIDYFIGLITKINDGTTTKTYKRDAIGNIVSLSDGSNEIKYSYFANGNLKEVNYDGIKTKFLQDGWGRKIQMEDPSAGIFKYGYNDFGELISEENKNGTTIYKLTTEGRLEGKTISGLKTYSKTTYTYNGDKLLVNTKFEDFSNGTNAITTAYTYDGQKRINNKTETTPYAVFSKDFSYDAFGRIYTEGSTATISGKSSSKTVRCNYKNGAPYQILDNSTNAVLCQTNTINARGQLLTAQNGPLTITSSYDVFGYNEQFKFDKTIPQANILSLNTVFIAKTGNLDSRSNSLYAWNESFKFDELDRLTEFTNINGIKETQAYDAKGRITQNNLGTYSYSKTNAYQNESIVVTSEGLAYYTTKPSQTIDYNVFKSPVLINEKNVDIVSFDYNDNNSRTAMFYGGLQDKKLERPVHKYYSGDGTMEIKENITTGTYDFVTYIGGNGYTAPIVYKSDGVASQKYLYLQRDYQGSIVAITDQTGTVVEKRLFDAWGSIAKVQDGAGNLLNELIVLDRGYTGHEHLQSVGLINMNARLYDPKLHRFLQPDNNIQDPFNTQNYNRYAYVMNNPLRYTDPSGEFWNVVFGYLFATYVKGAYESGGQLNPGKWDSNAWVSAVSSTVSGVGSYSATTGLNSYIDNYNNKPTLGSSAIGSGVSGTPFIQDYNYSFKDDPANVYVDGEKSELNNGDFATIGSLIGGVSGMLNEFSVMQFYNAAPKGKFAVNYNGGLRYWSESFAGGTRGNISNSFVQAAKSSSNSAKFVSKLGGVASITGTVLSYYGAATEFSNRSYATGTSEAISSTISFRLASTKGNIVGLAWTIGWEGGRAITNADFYEEWYRNTWHPYRFKTLGY